MHFILFQHMTNFRQLRELCNTNNYDFACPQEPWDRFAFYSAPFDFSNLRDSFFMSWSVSSGFAKAYREVSKVLFPRVTSRVNSVDPL